MQLLFHAGSKLSHVSKKGPWNKNFPWRIDLSDVIPYEQNVRVVGYFVVRGLIKCRLFSTMETFRILDCRFDRITREISSSVIDQGIKRFD